MFQIGDVVYLKSGGNPMTVRTIDQDGTVRCVWYGGEAGFPAACLIGDDPLPALAKKRRALETQFADAAVKAP